MPSPRGTILQTFSLFVGGICWNFRTGTDWWRKVEEGLFCLMLHLVHFSFVVVIVTVLGKLWVRFFFLSIWCSFLYRIPYTRSLPILVANNKLSLVP